MIGKKRARFIAVVIALAVFALCISLWVNEGPLWRMVMLKEYSYEHTRQHPVRGFVTRNWWSDEIAEGVRNLAYFVETGFIASEQIRVSGQIRHTDYNTDGTVRSQIIISESMVPDLQSRSFPPWLWGVTDQTEPTAPWWDHEKNAPKAD